MRLHVGKRSWLIYRTIAKLEEELDPALFIRVHRSAILRRDTIVGLSRDAMGHWAARLSDGSAQRICRSHIGVVKQLAGRTRARGPTTPCGHPIVYPTMPWTPHGDRPHVFLPVPYTQPTFPPVG